MTAPRIADARAAAAELRAAGVPAYVDPAEAAANLPCVLFLPPVVTFSRLGGASVVDWRLAVIADGPPGLDAWEALDGLLERLAEHVAFTTAEPGVYTLKADKPLPAYLCTATD